jgi:xylulokinase
LKSLAAGQSLALGLDLSTQSISAAAVDIDAGQKIYEKSLDFAQDRRLLDFGLQTDKYIVPAGGEGDACQPVRMYLAALEGLLADMAKDGLPLQNVVVVNVSGQQHGHVYLNRRAKAIFARLHTKDSASTSLCALLGEALAYDLAPIWMTSNTREQAEFMRQRVGGRERMIRLSGSDIPLRFTGPIMRRIGQKHPAVYQETANIQLISSFIPAVLTGDSSVPLDFGNACGMSLMNYSRKRWSQALIEAACCGLPGGSKTFRQKLPPIVAPTTIVGNLARYFCLKYGFREDCRIVVGSGDNPQSKVLVKGDLLSLGTSFVYMNSTDGKTMDWTGLANAMYDGIGRPFIFSCRTNGALVWDSLRAMYGLKKEDYAGAEDILRKVPPGRNLVFWQPRAESFPPSRGFGLTRIGGATPQLTNDYSGLIETTLAAVFCYSGKFSKSASEPLCVTGGAAASQEIIRRVSAIWARPVTRLEYLDSATGAAVAGICALCRSEGRELDVEQISSGLLKKGAIFRSSPEEVSAFHRPGGFLESFVREEERLLDQYPLGPTKLSEFGQEQC